MAVYRISGNPRTSATLEKLLEITKHIEALGVGFTAIAVRTTSGGQIDLTTTANLPADQLSHLGITAV